jgi:deoxyribodipyrimidine photo-lyase
MNPQRVRILNKGIIKSGPVVYWMQRDQRVHDNWALLYAQEKAIENNSPLHIVFNLFPDFLEATIRQYGFMLKGLEEIQSELSKYNIPFHLTFGKPGETIPEFVKKIKASLLVTDFYPIKIVRKWKESVTKGIDIPFHEVDAHNIVPCWIASPKLEFAAYTIRPKINKLLPDFLDDFLNLKKMKPDQNDFETIDWNSFKKKLKINFSVPEVEWIIPGESAAHNTLEIFLEHKFENFEKLRNDPTLNAQSNLSPYLHFGNISAQRIAISIQPLIEYPESQKSFLEELIIRRELADNFCFYNNDYDSFNGFHSWAKDSLNLHREDKRDFIYPLERFENAETHDPLWNAAQIEMTTKGKMHGFMRMYWAKKILEWTKSPEDALDIAIYLNDKYELDGRDPNGYAGIVWSIGGVHDRAWTERNVFGKIRYMNFTGCKRKFDVNLYIKNNLV